MQLNCPAVNVNENEILYKKDGTKESIALPMSNQNEWKAFRNEVLEQLGLNENYLSNADKNRIFHISIANKTGTSDQSFAHYNI